jgi:hypothetical protein
MIEKADNHAVFLGYDLKQYPLFTVGTVRFPSLCPCCGREATQNTVRVTGIRSLRSIGPVHRWEKLTLEVPHCSMCKKQIENSESHRLFASLVTVIVCVGIFNLPIHPGIRSFLVVLVITLACIMASRYLKSHHPGVQIEMISADRMKISSSNRAYLKDLALRNT